MQRLTGEAWLRSPLKRSEDIALSFAMAPLAVVGVGAGAVAVRAIDKVHPFFNQPRVGQDEELFIIHKLRTMPNFVGNDASTGYNDARASKVGKVLRKFRVDEAPQFINVLKGDMSIVGPRPLVPKDYEQGREILDPVTYKEWQEARRVAKPGLIHLFGVRYPEAKFDSLEAFWAERVACELEYIEQASPSLDHQIMLDSAGVALHFLKKSEAQ